MSRWGGGLQQNATKCKIQKGTQIQIQSTNTHAEEKLCKIGKYKLQRGQLNVKLQIAGG